MSHGTLLPSGRRSSAHTDIQLNYKYIIYPPVFCVKNDNENGALYGILASPTRGSPWTSPSGEARAYLKEGQFGKGSMEPKVRAAIRFAESRPGRTCVIGSLERAAEAMAGLSGTRIHV